MNGSMKSPFTNGDDGWSLSPKRQKLSHELPSSKLHESLQAQRQCLPIFAVRHKLLQQIRINNTVIIIGETGSGKTTQIPQYLFEVGLNQPGVIAVTQPRRVATVTIADRVAQEMNGKIGELVGYCIRFDDSTSPLTKIKYLTDGMLLREALIDPLLHKYSIIILDEAHERTVHTDVLFGVVKAAQNKRKFNLKVPLKVIVMSATMDVDHFSKYFNNAPVLYLEGRQHPVQVMYAKEPQPDYLFSSLVTVFQIHQETQSKGDILLFLTGQEEIESVTKTIRDIAKNLPFGCAKLIAYPLYASLPSAQQLAVFQPAPPGCRKVIIATNVAETSITISGIKYVIDPGFVKARTFNSRSGLELLKVHRISKAQAWQRTGRAGRDCSGICYRVYTEDEFSHFISNPVPEIQRSNLTNAALQLLSLGISDLQKFDFMDKPSPEVLQSALDQLELLGAVTTKDECKLTILGKQLSAFPLDPRYAKVILASKDFGCSDEIISIVALLSVDSIIYTPNNKREEANATRKKFLSNDGDPFTLLNIFHNYKNVNGNRQWCWENFVHRRNLQMAIEIRKQLLDICQHIGISLKSCKPDMTPARKCLVRGLFMNSAELQPSGNYITLNTRQTVTIHPSSCLFLSKPAYIIYTELIQTSKCYMRGLTVIDPEWLYEAAPSYFRQKRIKTS